MPPIIRGSQGKKTVISVKASLGAPLGGMRPDMPPSALGPNDFTNLENTRRVGGLVVSRGGQAEFVSLTGEATGMVDFQTGSYRRLYALGRVPASLNRLLSYSDEQSPKLQQALNYSYVSTTSDNPACGVFISEGLGDVPPQEVFLIGRQTAGSLTTLYGCDQMPVGFGLVPTDFQNPTYPIWTPNNPALAPNSGYRSIASILQQGSKLFVAVTQDGAIAGQVFAWDGRTVTYERQLSAGYATGMARYRGSLVVGFPPKTPGVIDVRSDAGVWTTVATSGATSSMHPGGMRSASYKDILYIPSAADFALFDGTALTVVLAATIGTTGGAIGACETAFRYLYFVWYHLASQILYVGRYDGTTWSQTHKSITAQFPSVGYVAGIDLAMRLYNGSLYITARKNAAGNAASNIYKSPLADTAGTWTEIDCTDPAFNGFSTPPTLFSLDVF